MKHGEPGPSLNVIAEGALPGTVATQRQEGTLDPDACKRAEVAPELPTEAEVGRTALQETTETEPASRPRRHQGYISEAPVFRDGGVEVINLGGFHVATVPSTTDDKPRPRNSRRQTPKN